MTHEATDYIACPFTVIIDSREQSSYSFRNIRTGAKDNNTPLIIKTERRGLATGDYAIAGLEDRCAVERKEMGDLFNCMGADRERFEQQLSRLNELDFGCVVVEADLMRIRRGHERSKLNPKTVHRSVIAYQIDYFPNVHWWFCPGKGYSEQTTFRILERYWKSHGQKEEET